MITEHLMINVRVRILAIILLVLGTGLACQLTSPRPASWAGTPTAEARETAMALTQQAVSGFEYVFTPTVPTIIPEHTPTLTVTPTPHAETMNGPWLVYPAPDESGLHAFDIGADAILEIGLPEPILMADLVRGRSPDGRVVILRAGSPLNTDELALYQVSLPSFETEKISPLLSITVQRKIVNEEGTRAFDALTAVTRPDGLAWSSDGRFLAFTAALNNETSDLYVLDTLNNRVDRLNGLFTQNASPLWAPGSNWLITQELENDRQGDGWRSELVSGLRVPNFDSQNTIYLPRPGTKEEVFVGWLNVHTFLSYSLTEDGPQLLRQVNVEDLKDSLIFEGLFQEVASDPGSGTLAFILSYEDAIPHGLSGGVYRMVPDSPVQYLQQAGNWDHLSWDPGGMFVAAGSQGVSMFTPDGDSMLFPNEEHVRLSANGNWMIAWGSTGARLYQSNNTYPLQTLIEGPVETLFWQPDSKAFYIQSAGSLYRFVFPGLRPIEIASGLPEDIALEMIWVE